MATRQKQSPWGQPTSYSPRYPHHPHPSQSDSPSHSNHSPSSSSSVSISSISSLTSPNANAGANSFRCLEITVTNGLQHPEAFLKSLEASSGRVQRAAIQFLSKSSVSMEDVDASSPNSTNSTNSTRSANESCTDENEDANEPNRTSKHKETADRSQGRQGRTWKMKVEFNTVKAATLAISRLRLNGLNNSNIDTDNNENVHLLAQRRANPQSRPEKVKDEAVRTATVEARIVEPKEAGDAHFGIERVDAVNNNTVNVEPVEALAELVAVQPLSGFILDDNDHLLDIRGYSVNNSPTSPWGKGSSLSPSPISTSSKIDGGYGDSRQSPSMSDKVREDGQNSQTAQNHYGASVTINGNMNNINNFIASPSSTSQPSQRNAVTAVTSSPIPAANGNDKRIVGLSASINANTTYPGPMTNMIVNPAAPTIRSGSAGSVESEDYSYSSATPSTASSSDMDMYNHILSHSRRESSSSFAFSLPSDSSPTLSHQLMESAHTSKLFPSIGMGAVGTGMPSNISNGYPTMASATNMGMGWGRNGSRGTTSASGASHTPSSSLSSLSSLQHDPYDQYAQYPYDPQGHYEYDAFDDEFDQVVALGLDLSRLEVIDPASQRTPTEWRAKDNIFTSPSIYNDMGSWVQPISKPQPIQKPLTLPLNVNARPYASVATAGITRTGTVIAEPERSPLPYINHPRLPQNERKSVQAVTPPPPSHTSQPQHPPSLPQQKQSLSSPQYTKVAQAGNSPIPVSPATGLIKAEGFVKPAHVQGSGSGPSRKNPAGQHRPTYSTSTSYSRHSDTSSNSSAPSQTNKYSQNKQSNSKPSHAQNVENGNGSDNGKKYHKSRQDKRLYASDPHAGPRPTDWMLSEETKRTRAIRDARFAQIVAMGLAPGRTKAGWAQARRPGKRDRDAAKARLRAMEEEKEREMLQALLNDGTTPSPSLNAELPLQAQAQAQTA